MVYMIVLAFYALLIIGGTVLDVLTTQYDALVLFHFHLSVFQSFFIGLLTGGLSIIVAIILKFLALLGFIAGA